MRRLVSGVLLGGAAVVLAVSSALAAPMMVKFHAPAGTSMKSLMHATGSATITYNKTDAVIKVTTDNLPAVAMVHGKFYVVWAQSAGMNTYAGILKSTGMMAGGKYTIMNTKFTKLAISAEKTMHPTHAMGTTVLVATVMHH